MRGRGTPLRARQFLVHELARENANMQPPPLSDLALIGDRRRCAVIDREAAVCWYAPHRLDLPSIFCALLDPERGAWRIDFPGARPKGRRYLGESAVLETVLAGEAGELAVTDWMNLGEAARPGLFCRAFSPAPSDITVTFDAWTGYGEKRALAALVGGAAVFADGMHLFASHPLRLDAHGVSWVLPRGARGWTVLSDSPCDAPRMAEIERWKAATLERWEELAQATTYRGPYSSEARASLRALRLLVFEPTGAVAAAATAGLPEVIGGVRNYDYRYCWLRDSDIMVRALLRTAKRSSESDAFLSFIASSRAHCRRDPLDPVIGLDGHRVREEWNPPLRGYRHSNPVRIGNRAAQQLQLGALGTLLLAAGTLYRERERRPHWDMTQAVADFLAAHWREADSGIWESDTPRQYTTSKAFTACGLDAIAPFADAARCRRYREAAAAIRDYVRAHCLTSEGAFAAFAGSNGVDVSAALFPVWSFCAADCAEMKATIRVLQRDYEADGLFKREDETPQSRAEGAFLAGSFWVAHYWICRGDERQAHRYIEAGLAHANDLGIFPEEVDIETGAALRNLPLGMAHASFLSAVADLTPPSREAPAETTSARRDAAS